MCGHISLSSGKKGERMGIATGKLEVLVLESRGSSWPDEFDLCEKLRS